MIDVSVSLKELDETKHLRARLNEFVSTLLLFLETYIKSQFHIRPKSRILNNSLKTVTGKIT